MSDLFNLTGKVALVTGASSGLGVQFAKALAREGADIAIVARRSDRLLAVKKEVEAMGVRCFAQTCDVTDNAKIKQMVEAVKAEYEKIDILVNNAGSAVVAKAEEQTDDEWNNLININLNSVYFVAREVGKVMIENNYGKIINIGSLHSSVAMANSYISAYCTSKGGVLLMTRALAVEWAKHNITVNAIGPAYFMSEMTQSVIDQPAFLETVKTYCPMGRPGKEGELDGALVYLASDASSYTTGQIIPIDGGWTAI